jgi:hypothetical protein
MSLKVSKAKSSGSAIAAVDMAWSLDGQALALPIGGKE